MTDERLRELEQRWKASGSPEDEAGYLLERVRTGDLEREKLELAAYCGHEGARLALGDEAPETTYPDYPQDELACSDWIDVFPDYGKEACVRVGTVMAELILPAISRESQDRHKMAEESLRLARAWIEAPSTHIEAEASDFVTVGFYDEISMGAAGLICLEDMKPVAQEAPSRQDLPVAYVMALAQLADYGEDNDSFNVTSLKAAVLEAMQGWLLS